MHLAFVLMEFTIPTCVGGWEIPRLLVLVPREALSHGAALPPVAPSARPDHHRTLRHAGEDRQEVVPAGPLA